MTSLAGLSRKYKALLLGGVAFLVLCGISAVLGSRGWFHLRQLQDQQQGLEDLAFGLERSNERLRDHLNRIETDDAYLEKLVRERLGWVRPGELVYRVHMPPAAAADHGVGALEGVAAEAAHEG